MLLQLVRRSKKFQPKVNTDKTEYTSVSKGEEGWKEVKQ